MTRFASALVAAVTVMLLVIAVGMAPQQTDPPKKEVALPGRVIHSKQT